MKTFPLTPASPWARAAQFAAALLLALCGTLLLSAAPIRAQQTPDVNLPQVEAVETIQQSDVRRPLSRTDAFGTLADFGIGLLTMPSATGGNVAAVTQLGVGNVTELTQIGIGNETTLLQNGTGNVFDVTLNGDRNRLAAAQIGNDNRYELEYTGDDLGLGQRFPMFSLQIGNGNQAVQLNTSPSNPPHPVVQIGNGSIPLLIRHH